MLLLLLFFYYFCLFAIHTYNFCAFMSTGKTRRKSLRPGTSSDEVCEIATDAKKLLFLYFISLMETIFLFLFWGGGGGEVLVLN